MGSFSIWHWMVVLLVVLLLFGGGKVSSLMGDFAKGIKSFKKNMAEGEDASMEASADKPTRNDRRAGRTDDGGRKRERTRGALAFQLRSLARRSAERRRACKLVAQAKALAKLALRAERCQLPRSRPGRSRRPIATQ